jgi:hypothetical protein
MLRHGFGDAIASALVSPLDVAAAATTILGQAALHRRAQAKLNRSRKEGDGCPSKGH